jgi:hypothetical protein
MASLIDRIDNLGAKSYPAMKSGESYFSLGYGGYIPSGDLSRDEYGAAAAYAVIAEVLAAIAVWETFLDGVTWVVRDKKTGEEIARTDQQVYPLEERGGKWFAAVKRFESRYFHSFWKSLAFSDWLYGNSYIALLKADSQYRPTHTNYAGLKWLNPLNTSPMIINGAIQYFQYNGMEQEVPHQTAPQDMAYRINRRDAFNDLYGYSGVLSAMDAINLSRNTIRAFKNFFSNGMQLGGVISPVDQDVWSDRELENARREWASNHKGAANAGRWAVIPKRASITPFGQEDASSNFTVTKDLRNQIFMALSVPPQLAGDPSDATYDNAKDIKRQWWETFAIPYAKDIAGFNSTVVIPKLEPDAGVYIEADTSAYEIEDPDVISQDINAGIIDISTARMKRGYPVEKDLQGIYVIAGRPMSKATILSLANTLPASEVQQAAQAGKYEAEAQAIEAAPVSPEPVNPETEAPIEDEPFASLEPVKHVHTHDHLPPLIEADNLSELDELQQLRDSYVKPLEELEAWGKFVRSGKHQKRQFNPEHLSRAASEWIQDTLNQGDKQHILDVFKKVHDGLPYEAITQWKPNALRGDIGDSLLEAIKTHDSKTILDAFKAAFDKLSVKAIQATRLGFENDFDELLKRARAEKMGRVQWASAMRAILRRYGTKAYIDGMADGGVEDEPSEDDLIAINQLHSQNSSYVTELGNVLYKEDGISDAQADVKAAMWFNKSINPYYQAGLLSADENGIYEWYRKHGKDSCITCVGNEGKRLRLKTWKARGMPQSEVLECGGFECECGLHRVRGKTRDRVQ